MATSHWPNVAMTTHNAVSTLRRPADFWAGHAEQLPLRTYSALRYHLRGRQRNGLISTGAVVESPIGLLIDPERFGHWLLGGGPP